MQDVPFFSQQWRQIGVFSLLIAAGGDAHRHYGLQPLRHLGNLVQHLGHLPDRAFQFDDGRQDLLIKDIVADQSALRIAHQRRNRIALLELDTQGSQRLCHLLDLLEAHPDPGAAEFHGEPRLANLDAPGDVVGLHFLSTAPVHSGALVRHLRVAEGASTTRGQVSSSGANAAVGQTSGSGSKRRRNTASALRMVRTRTGLRCSWLIPRKQA